MTIGELIGVGVAFLVMAALGLYALVLIPLSWINHAAKEMRRTGTTGADIVRGFGDILLFLGSGILHLIKWLIVIIAAGILIWLVFLYPLPIIALSLLIIAGAIVLVGVLRYRRSSRAPSRRPGKALIFKGRHGGR